MTENRADGTLVAVEEAARALDTTPLSVLMRIKRNHLQGCEIDGRWFVDGDSLARLLAEGPTEGAEPLCRSHCSVQGGCSSCR